MPPRWQAWLTVMLLFTASIVSVIDRSLLSIVVDPVRAELGISDFQVSLLQGIAFGLFYATMGVWLGLVADRANRRNLIIVGIILWSLATAAGGFARGFGEFFVSRMLVGLGEAALAPAAISLIADLFEPGKRGRPIGVYLMGQALAHGLALTIAGGLLQAADAGAFTAMPILGDLTPWRITFVVCGLGGSLVGVAFFMVREPARQGGPARAENFSDQARRSLSYFRIEWRQYLGVYLGFALFFLGAYGTAMWKVAMVSRQYNMSPAEVSLLFGPLALIFGLIGPFVGGTMVDWVTKRSGVYGLLGLLSVVPLLAIPSAAGVLAGHAYLAIFLMSTQAGCAAIVGSATLAYLQSATPADMRGFSVSLTGLVNTLLGSSLGPLFIALVTEQIFRDDSKVGWGIFFVAVPAFVAAALLFAWTARMNAGRRASSVENENG